MYWNNSTRVLAISDAMSVNRFEHLKRFFHVSNNRLAPKKYEDNYDPLYKVRPIFDSALIKCRGLIQEEFQSIDEQIVPTKARAPIWQNLPYKWGFKIWARCGVNGVLYDFNVYVGKSNDYDPDVVRDFGKVGAVVIKLTNTLPSNMNHKVYMENLFSSLKLFKYLKQEGIWCVGTIRGNRLEGGSSIMKSKKQSEKELRGSMDYRLDANSNITLLQ